ncbi:MAG: hypothetical protein KDJ73_14510 [Notoacmeibacter sp.]|nr:hypothetical protein [Notoacmeibacter sp.]MCC0032773.1 hypothetical protein [Brucellaceae bacterium]
MNLSVTADNAALVASAHGTEEGRDSLRPAMPLLVLAVIWLAAAIVFGAPAIIFPALAAVAAVFYVLIQLTLGKVEVS